MRICAERFPVCDIRTLRLGITHREGGKLSDVLSLFRVLMPICRNLENFELLKIVREKRYEKDLNIDANSTMTVLERLPYSLKTVYAGFHLKMESFHELEALKKRMHTFLKIHQNLTSVRKL